MVVAVNRPIVSVSGPWSDTITPDKLAERWRAVGAPYRMTDIEKQIYERFLPESTRHIDNPKMVVLGATPELREIGHKYGYRVTCVDYSKTWIEAMELLMDGEAEKDTIVRCNWLEIPLQRGVYDVVVGDGALTLIEIKNWDRLLQIVHGLLKPTGYFISRTPVGIGAPVPLVDTLEIFGQRLLRYPEKYMASLCYATMRPQNKMGNIIIEEELERLHNNGGLTSDEFDTIYNHLSKMFRVRSAAAYMLEQKHHEKVLSKYFQIKSLDYDKVLYDIEKPLGIWCIYCLANKS